MSNTNQMATLASVQDKVRERIQATFVDLIPEELWRGMVEREIKNITENDLPRLAREEAEKMLRELIRKELSGVAWADYWDNESRLLGPRASAMVTQAVKEAAPELVSALFGRMAQGIVSDLRNNIQRY